MEPVANTPTKPVDYAVLSGVYGGLLGALALAARKGRGADEALTGTDVAVTGAATFALAKLLTNEKVESWLRAPFVEETPSGEQKPKGRRMRYAIGELLTCSRCAGAWSALGVVGLRVLSPGHGARGHERAGRLRGQRLPAERLSPAVQRGQPVEAPGRAGRAGSAARAPERGYSTTSSSSSIVPASRDSR